MRPAPPLSLTLPLSLALHAALIGALVAGVPGRPAPVAPAVIALRFAPPAIPAPTTGAAGTVATAGAAGQAVATGAQARHGARANPDAPPGVRLAVPDPTVIPARAALGNPPPDYPAGAAARGEQGTVVLRLSIGPDGRVERVEKLRSSGFPTLDDAAMSAVARWRFLPARADGRPVASQRDQPVRFALD